MPSAAALVPLPMDETTPPVTKTYLVSLIYTPGMRTNATPLPSLRVGMGKESPVGRGIIASRKPLLRHTCMDLYHTTSRARMKQEIAQWFSTMTSGPVRRGHPGLLPMRDVLARVVIV